MITSEQLARQMAVFSYTAKTKKLSSLVGVMNYSVLQIVNATYEGERLGLFTVKRGKKSNLEKIEVSDEQFAEIVASPSNFGEGIEQLYNSAVELVRNFNSVESDVEEPSLGNMAPVSVVTWEVLVFLLRNSGDVVHYRYADPLDRKSVYDFYTLPSNVEKKWYRKQFKSLKKK